MRMNDSTRSTESLDELLAVTFSTLETHSIQLVIQGLYLVLWSGGMGVRLSHFPGYLWFFT